MVARQITLKLVAGDERDERSCGMRHFDEIVAMAASRQGGISELEDVLATSRSRTPEAIAATPDDRILAAMARRIFQAGFAWKVVDAKWDGFEEAFDGFDPARCASMSEERFDALLKDRRIIRNAAKIRSVTLNGQFLLDLATAHGSAARFLADWPDTNYVGLLDLLKTRANRLGGEPAMRFLRSIGKPAFITTPDVVAALVREQILTEKPSGKRGLAMVQEAFNKWSAESGRDLTAISRVLAMSVASAGAREARPR
jgi:3-methyladenine DNA glycosylase Tag